MKAHKEWYENMRILNKWALSEIEKGNMSKAQRILNSMNKLIDEKRQYLKGCAK